MASVLKRIPNAPHVEVYRTPADAGITISGPMPKGGVLQDGRVLVFTNGAESVVDVHHTVFLEISLHRFGNEETWLLTGWDDVESGDVTAGNANDTYASDSSGIRSQEGADKVSVATPAPEAKAILPVGLIA